MNLFTLQITAFLLNNVVLIVLFRGLARTTSVTWTSWSSFWTLRMMTPSFGMLPKSNKWEVKISKWKIKVYCSALPVCVWSPCSEWPQLPGEQDEVCCPSWRALQGQDQPQLHVWRPGEEDPWIQKAASQLPAHRHTIQQWVFVLLYAAFQTKHMSSTFNKKKKKTTFFCLWSGIKKEPNKSWTPRTIMIGGKVSDSGGVFLIVSVGRTEHWHVVKISYPESDIMMDIYLVSALA